MFGKILDFSKNILSFLPSGWFASKVFCRDGLMFEETKENEVKWHRNGISLKIEMLELDLK